MSLNVDLKGKVPFHWDPLPNLECRSPRIGFKLKYQVVSEENYKQFLVDLQMSKACSVDTETTSLEVDIAQCVTIQIRTQNFNFVLPTGHLLHKNLPKEIILAFLEELYNRETIYFWNALFDLRILEYNFGLQPQRFTSQIVDVSELVFLCDTNHPFPALKWAEAFFLGVEAPTFDEFGGEDIRMVPFEKVAYYAAHDSWGTYEIGELLLPPLMKNFAFIVKMDRRFMPALYELEEVPQLIDREGLEKSIIEIQSELERTKKEFYENYGFINPNSKKQVRDLLVKLGYNTNVMTKGGKSGVKEMSVSIKALENLEEAHVAKLLITWSRLTKIYSSYFLPLKERLDFELPVRVHYVNKNAACLVAGSQVPVEGKGLLNIEDVQVGDRVWTRAGFKPVYQTSWHDVAASVRVYFHQGTVLEGTLDHPVLLEDGSWKNLGDLEVEDRVNIVEVPTFSEKTQVLRRPSVLRGRKEIKEIFEVDNEFAYLVGAIAGDGFVAEDKVGLCFSSYEEEYMGIVKEIFERRVGPVSIAYAKDNTIHMRYCSTDMSDWWKELGLRDNCVPKFIRQGSRSKIENYVAGLLDTDGCISAIGPREVVDYRFSGKKLVLLRQLQCLLQMIGIDTNLSIRNNGVGSLRVRGDSKYTFNRIIVPLLRNPSKQERARELRVDGSRNKNSWIAKVKKVVSCGPCRVYNIAVEDQPEYVVNGVITHNTYRLSCGGYNNKEKDMKNKGHFIALNLQSAPKPSVKLRRFDFDFKEWKPTFHENGKYCVETGDPYLSFRKNFIVEDGYIVASLDFSSQELVIIAELSREPAWFQALKNGDDLHMSTAKMVWGENAGGKERKLAKTFNYAMNYGGTAWTLASKLKIPVHEAEKYVQDYNKALRQLTAWKAKQIMFGRRYGYVQNLYGLPRHVYHFYRMGNKYSSYADRTCLNHPVQSVGGVMIRLAIIKAQALIKKKYGDKAQLLSTIHDELNFKLHKSIAMEAIREIKTLMESTWPASCELRIEAGVSIGENWGELLPVKLDDSPEGFHFTEKWPDPEESTEKKPVLGGEFEDEEESPAESFESVFGEAL